MKAPCQKVSYSNSEEKLNRDILEFVWGIYEDCCENTCGSRIDAANGFPYYPQNPVVKKSRYHGSVYFWEQP